MLKFQPSLLAAAIYIVQCSLKGIKYWTKTCEQYTTYMEDQLFLMECLLNASLEYYPLSLPDLHNYVEYPGSPLANRTNHSAHREKRSEGVMFEGTSQYNKRRHKKDSFSLEKSNPNENLKQPTIVDAFKRAGVIVSQEVNESYSGHSSNGMTSQSIKSQDIDSNEHGPMDISTEFKVLDLQRFKFRPLLVDCLLILSFSEEEEHRRKWGFFVL